MPYAVAGGIIGSDAVDRSGDFLNAKRDFGAKGDNSTDDTSALNTFYSVCIANGVPGFIPGGTYLHTGLTYTASGNGGLIVGGGNGITRLKLINGSVGPCLTYVGAAGDAAQTTFQDLFFDGNFTGTHGIYCQGPGGNFGQGPNLMRVNVFRTGLDCLYADVNANAGAAYLSSFSHPGRNCANFKAGDWVFTSCGFGGADRSGFGVSNVTNSAGLIKITTSTAHGLSTGATVFVWTVQGTGALPTNATGTFVITVIDTTNFTLNGSTFSGTYTGNGQVTPRFAVTGAADNGSGLVRITATGHGYTTGKQVFLRDVGGVPNANGGWVVTVITANTFDLQGSQFSGSYTSGGTVMGITAGLAFFGPGAATSNNQFIGCNIFTSAIGVLVTTPNQDPLKIDGGTINANWMHGMAFQTNGLACPHSVAAVNFNTNSAVLASTYADIYLSNTREEAFIGTQHFLSIQPVKYLIESDGTCGSPILFLGFVADQSGGIHTPYTTGISTTFGDTGVPYGRYSWCFGQGNNANVLSFAACSGNNVGGTFSSGFGENNSGNGNASHLFGLQCSDKGVNNDIVLGGGAYTNTGDNQTRLLMLSSKTTDATPTRLFVGDVTGAGSASATNTLNLFFNRQKMAYDRITVLCSNPANDDFAQFVVDNLVVQRGSSIATILMNGSASNITMTQVRASAALSATSVVLSVDTTNGGVAVTATGVAATTLHWSLKAAPLEIV